jgi:hypothetical protein
LERAEFRDVVKKAWGESYNSADFMEIWQCKIRSFRRRVRGWAANVVAELNREKQAIAAELNWLDMEPEKRPLEVDELNTMKALAKDLDRI